VHSEIRDLLQGAQQSANALQTECKFVLAASLPELAANLATFLEWSRLQDEDGSATSSSRISPSTLITSRPPFAAPAPTRCAARATSWNCSSCATFPTCSSSSPTTRGSRLPTTSRKSVNEKQAAIVAGIVVAPRVIKRVDTIYAETILKTFFADDALRTIYREKAARIRGASGTSIARLAAIRSSIANVRPKLQRLILETVAVKPLLATGFGAQAGRIHSDFRRRVRRVTRVNDWTSD